MVHSKNVFILLLETSNLINILPAEVNAHAKAFTITLYAQIICGILVTIVLVDIFEFHNLVGFKF